MFAAGLPPRRSPALPVRQGKNQKRTLLFVTGPQCRSAAAPKSRIARPAGQESKKNFCAKLRFAPVGTTRYSRPGGRPGRLYLPVKLREAKAKRSLAQKVSFWFFFFSKKKNALTCPAWPGARRPCPRSRACSAGRTCSSCRPPRRAGRRGSPPAGSRSGRRRTQRSRSARRRYRR